MAGNSDEINILGSFKSRMLDNEAHGSEEHLQWELLTVLLVISDQLPIYASTLSKYNKKSNTAWETLMRLVSSQFIYIRYILDK